MTSRPKLCSLAGIAIAAVLATGCDTSETPRDKPKANAGPAAVSHERSSPAKQDRTAEATPIPRSSPEPVVADVAIPAKSAAPNKLPPVDEDRIAAHGIRKVEGEWLTLYTDLPVDAEIERLPDVFALAMPQWCRYFQTDESELADLHVRGCLMRDRERFTASGLLPADLEFINGFTRGRRIWWQEQPTAYYRRHLMLHEGTHAVMFARYGACGPAWYMEGLAELLGTHQLVEGELTLGYFPVDPETVPFWGRIKMVQDTVRAGHALSIVEVMAYPINSELENEAYGWCWAIAAFLDGHPRYRQRFRQLLDEVAGDDFNRRFAELFADDWRALKIEWQTFIHDLDFDYDLVRNAIEFRVAEPLAEAVQTVSVAADRGWQSSGIRLEAGTSYELTASGRYQVANELKIWWCEPGGVTIRYYRGRPLGKLLALVVPEDVEENAWPQPVATGQQGELVADSGGTLYLRINDLPGELADNAGSLEVRIRANGDPAP